MYLYIDHFLVALVFGAGEPFRSVLFYFFETDYSGRLTEVK